MGKSQPERALGADIEVCVFRPVNLLRRESKKKGKRERERERRAGMR